MSKSKSYGCPKCGHDEANKKTVEPVAFYAREGWTDYGESSIDIEEITYECRNCWHEFYKPVEIE